MEEIVKKCKNIIGLGRIKSGELSRCYDIGNAFRGQWRKTSFINYDTNNVPDYVIKTLGNDTPTFTEIKDKYEETLKVWKNSQIISI